jgi:WD40 repeat protein
VHLAFPAHDNAIIDLTFSDDDRYIATASGDQSGKVIEMESQTTVSVLANHTASVKQVRFQPGQNNCTVLATSSRDGSIQFWDLRCSNGVRPVQEITGRPQGLEFRVPPNPNSGCVRTSIYDAHGRPPLHRYQTRQNPNLHLTSLPSPAAMSSDIGSRSEVPGRIGDVSVTAIQFLPQGQEHLLLSASEADSTVKLWDLRHVQQSAKSARNAYPVPVSYTRQPDSHLSFRPFGISALAMSGDGSRFYTLCKDNTVYAYSTSHLIAGQAPELGLRAGLEAPRRGRTQAHVGLGPLYGFRHPSFLATSFYIKAAVRPARDGRPEMLAVGSMDACPVLFPTDERYFRRDLGAGPGAPLSGVVDDRSSAVAMISPGGGGGGGSGARPGMLTRTNSVGGGFSARLNDTVPVYKPYGTALVRGHEKEVGPLAWTHDGKLVTVADDYTVRCWGENREKATDLRRGGEVNGRRWGCGWADVGENWDGDEDDW